MEKFFVSRPIFALSLAIVIVLVGLISILNLPIEQYQIGRASCRERV